LDCQIQQRQEGKLQGSIPYKNHEQKERNLANILLATAPWPGRVNPLPSVVRKLIEREHKVWWYTGEQFKEKVEATGARLAPMSEDLNIDYKNLDTIFPARKRLNGLALLKHDLKHLFIDSAMSQLKGMEAIIGEFPIDVLLVDPTVAPGASVLFEKKGVPWAVLGTSLMPFSSRDTAPYGTGLPPSSSVLGRFRNRLVYWIVDQVVFRDVARYANKLRASMELPPLRCSLWDVSLSPFLYMACTTPSVEYPRSDLPPQVHFVGPLLLDPPTTFDPPHWWGELETAERPVVHVTQGTLSNDPSCLVIPAIKALAEEDVLVVVTIADRSQEEITLGSLPANVRVEHFIPYYHLLPHIDVMVTNGGYGGVQMAHAHGIPLVGAGKTEDKHEVCNRIVRAGVGINLKTLTPTPEQIRGAVKEILANPTYKKKADQVRREFAQYDPQTQAVTLLEKLIETNRPVLRENLTTLWSG
jgi:UDP:flavonoid glycosyltransferase YjiC (YdhE family)